MGRGGLSVLSLSHAASEMDASFFSASQGHFSRQKEKKKILECEKREQLPLPGRVCRWHWDIKRETIIIIICISPSFSIFFRLSKRDRRRHIAVTLAKKMSVDLLLYLLSAKERQTFAYTVHYKCEIGNDRKLPKKKETDCCTSAKSHFCSKGFWNRLNYIHSWAALFVYE